MQSWKTSISRAPKRAIKHVGLSTLAIGILASCNYADIRPKADIDGSVVTRSVAPSVTTQIIPEITPDFAPEVQSALPLTQPDSIESFVDGPKVIKRVPDQLVGAAKATPARVIGPAITATETKKSEKGSLLGMVTAGLIPRFNKPSTNGLPKSEAQCRTALKRAGVVFENVDKVGNGSGGGCGIQYPVKITAFSGKVEMKPAATLNCKMALKLSDWVRKDLQPAARLRYATGVKSIGNMGSYSCRKIAGSKRWSEHSYGNAIDIGSITLNRGQKVVVQRQGVFALRSRSLLNEVRSDACKRFTTVLGPGYNKAHADHFHFDLMSRRKTSCN